MQKQIQDKASTKKKWDSATDLKLLELVMVNGPCAWETFAQQIQGRNGKQCRERWANQLNPLLNQGTFSVQESILIIMFQQDKRFENQWTRIAQLVAGRTDGQIKNHWNQHLKNNQASITQNINSNMENYMKLSAISSPLGTETRSEDLNSIRKVATNKMMHHMMKKTQKFYMEYLNQKRAELKRQIEFNDQGEVMIFYYNLLGRTCTMFEFLKALAEKDKSCRKKKVLEKELGCYLILKFQAETTQTRFFRTLIDGKFFSVITDTMLSQALQPYVESIDPLVKELIDQSSMSCARILKKIENSRSNKDKTSPFGLDLRFDPSQDEQDKENFPDQAPPLASLSKKDNLTAQQPLALEFVFTPSLSCESKGPTDQTEVQPFQTKTVFISDENKESLVKPRKLFTQPDERHNQSLAQIARPMSIKGQRIQKQVTKELHQAQRKSIVQQTQNKTVQSFIDQEPQWCSPPIYSNYMPPQYYQSAQYQGLAYFSSFQLQCHQCFYEKHQPYNQQIYHQQQLMTPMMTQQVSLDYESNRTLAGKVQAAPQYQELPQQLGSHQLPAESLIYMTPQLNQSGLISTPSTTGLNPSYNRRSEQTMLESNSASVLNDSDLINSHKAIKSHPHQYLQQNSQLQQRQQERHEAQVRPFSYYEL